MNSRQRRKERRAFERWLRMIDRHRSCPSNRLLNHLNRHINADYPCAVTGIEAGVCKLFTSPVDIENIGSRCSWGGSATFFFESHAKPWMMFQPVLHVDDLIDGWSTTIVGDLRPAGSGPATIRHIGTSGGHYRGAFQVRYEIDIDKLIEEKPWEQWGKK